MVSLNVTESNPISVNSRHSGRSKETFRRNPQNPQTGLNRMGKLNCTIESKKALKFGYEVKYPSLKREKVIL